MTYHIVEKKIKCKNFMIFKKPLSLMLNLSIIINTIDYRNAISII